MLLRRLPDALHLGGLPLLQKFSLLSMLVFQRRLRLCVGMLLLIQIGVIALLHLRQGIALLLLPRLQR
jgi:hypothetical protein